MDIKPESTVPAFVISMSPLGNSVTPGKLVLVGVIALRQQARQ